MLIIGRSRVFYGILNHHYIMPEYNYFNGQIIPSAETKIHVSDLAFLRGYGIFDFFRVVKRRPVFLSDHLDRFESGARQMGLPVTESRERLLDIISELIRLNPDELLGIKIILTGGYSADGFTPAKESNLLILPKPFALRDPADGLKLMLLEYQREIPQVKTLNYVTPIRMLSRLAARKADDFLYHSRGLVSESSRSNIFIVKNEQIITPKTGVLPGITRKHLITKNNRLFPIEQRDVTLTETLAADEVFVTRSSQRIQAVAQIDDRVFNNGKPGKITEKLREFLLREEIQD
jgi:D-alanine transaminase/branched-chain amino acid aminotransferase